MKAKPNIICLGHVCIDRNSSEGGQYIGWGSGTLHMSAYFQQHGIRPGIITSYGPDLLRYARDFTLLPAEPNQTETLTFENIIQPNAPRKWYAHKIEASAPPTLTPELRAEIAHADMIVAAMLLPNYGADWLKDALSTAKPGCLKVLCPQGYLRAVDGNGLVSPRVFEEADAVLPLFDQMFISEEDTPNALKLAQGWKRAAQSTNIIVTDGPGGATIVHENDFQHIPTTPIPPEKIVDSVGCGDVFAAAVSLALYAGDPLDLAVVFGHAAAGRKLLAASSKHTGGAARSSQ